MNSLTLWAVLALMLALVLANTALLLWLALRLRQHGSAASQQEQQRAEAAHKELLATIANQSQNLERALRQAMADSARGLRQELAHNLATFQQSLTQQSAEATRTQNSQIDAFGQQLALLQKTLADTLTLQLGSVSESTARRMAEIRQTLEAQLTQLQSTNAAKLDEMRATVDEKLQSTLQTRLGESFKLVAERLEQVHKGLGEMQTLAQGVGDLKHLLSNVKTRGMFGEAQLQALLEQVLVPEQYAANIATLPGSKNVVDFAIRLPGRSDNGAPLWLPIDAKFPSEDYERLLDAQGRADAPAAEAAAKALELRIRLEAKSINEKYVGPPHTTDFAILFCPPKGCTPKCCAAPA